MYNMGPPLGPSPVPALGALLEGEVVTRPRKMVGQGLRPLPKAVPHGCPRGTAGPWFGHGSHIAQLHRGEVGSGQMRLKGRTLVLPGCGWHRGRRLGLGPSTQAQVPRLFPGAAQMSFKEKSGKLRLSETRATQ